MTNLKPLIREERIAAWCDREIKPGDRWSEEIDQALGSARVAVLLVSRDFLASDFIMKHELPHLLEAAESRGVKLLWVLLIACAFDRTPLVKLQAAYNPARPLVKLQRANRDAALTEIAAQILKAVETPGDAQNQVPADDEEATRDRLRLEEKPSVVGGGGDAGRLFGPCRGICRLRTPNVQLRRRRSEEGKVAFLHVTAREGPFTSQYPLAAYEHGLAAEDLQHFLEQVTGRTAKRTSAFVPRSCAAAPCRIRSWSNRPARRAFGSAALSSIRA